MFTHADIEKLGTVHAVHPAVLSLYLTVPRDPAPIRGLPARAGELIGAARGDSGHIREEDLSRVRQTLARCRRDWLGGTVAIFACADAGLFETLLLPRSAPDRAVVGTRPHIRPLLAIVQRCPAFRVVVVGRQHVLMFCFAGDEVEAVSAPAASAPDPNSGGWYGLATYGVPQRVIQLAHRHYGDTAAMLEQVVRRDGPEPLVVGGYDDGIQHVIAYSPPVVRECFAGSFTADTRTLTPARVRDLAAPIVARWADQRTQRLTGEIIDTAPGGQAATGLPACLAAVSDGAVETLVVPDEGLVPGYECGRCGALSADADGCPDWGAAPLPVPDVIEEMVARTLEDGGQILVTRGNLSPVAARLYAPPAGSCPAGTRGF